MMTKRQRIETVLAGEVPDKTPISLWYHFGTQHEPGDIIAQLALEFFRYYDLDWLKVMNDYPYPLIPNYQKYYQQVYDYNHYCYLHYLSQPV